MEARVKAGRICDRISLEPHSGHCQRAKGIIPHKLHREAGLMAERREAAWLPRYEVSVPVPQGAAAKEQGRRGDIES